MARGRTLTEGKEKEKEKEVLLPVRGLNILKADSQQREVAIFYGKKRQPFGINDQRQGRQGRFASCLFRGAAPLLCSAHCSIVSVGMRI